MMKSPKTTQWLPLLCALFFSTLLPAQNTVSGSLFDEEGLPLSYASIMVLQAADSILVKGKLSQDDGSFIVQNIPDGDYLVGISMVGYTDLFTQPFTLAKSDQELGALKLSSGALELEAIEVVARKPLYEQRIDRLVVNVAESITSSGNTALEVLERSPGVVVDRLSERISISGKEGVVVMINNKVNQLPIAALIQMLAGMPADNIDRIEIITTPPANFDAQGNAGIISIIMRKNLEEGFNGTASGSLGYGYFEKYGGNVNFNYRNGNFSLFGDYGHNFNRTWQEFTNYRAVTFENVRTESNNISDRNAYTRTQNARLGADIQLNDQTVVGVLTSWGDRYWYMDAINTLDLTIDNQLREQLVSDNNEINQWKNFLANVNLQHQFSEQSRVSFDFDYVLYDNNNPTYYFNQTFSPQQALLATTEMRVRKKTPIDIYVAKGDYNATLAENWQLEAGFKGTFSRFDNDFGVENLQSGQWVNDSRFGGIFALEEQIGALYSALSWEVSGQTSLKAGLRYEYTESNLGSEEEPDIVDRKYGNFFPSLFLTQKTGAEQEVQLSYSRRINRPAYTQLAPFVIFFDPNTFIAGNVALQPDFTDALRLGYRYRSWFLNLEHSYTDQAITAYQPQIDPETNMQVNTAANLDYRRTVSANLSFPLKLSSWWSSRSNILGLWAKNEASFTGEVVSITNTALRISTTHTFQLPGELTFEVSGFYMSPTVFGFIKSRPLGDINLGLQKELKGTGGTLRFNVSRLLLQSNYIAVGKVPELNLDYRGKYGFAERTFTLSYSQPFGNNAVKAARRRNGGSEEERGRVNY